MENHRDFRVGQWQVLPERNLLAGPEREVRLSARAIDVLCHLAEHPGEVVSRDEFTIAVWGDTVVTDDALTGCISEIRRALSDSAANPKYIETIPKRGYRLIAPVEPLADSPGVANDSIAARMPERLFAGTRYRAPAITVALVLVALAGWWWHGNRAPEILEPSLAVLPFENFMADEDRPFADGLHHDLLTRLSAIADLRVISRTSVMRYRGTTRTIGEIAAELGVNWVLEGAVQQVGDQIQLNAQLINARTDSHVWAKTYQRTLTAENLFAIQAEITEDISRSLRANLKPQEQDRVARIPTDNLDAYFSFIQARTLLGQRTAVGMRNAAEMFGYIIEQDPEFAAAWAGLADAQVMLVYYGHGPLPQLPDARVAANRALELDGDLAYAHQVQGQIHMAMEHDGPAALEAFGRANELSGYIGWLAWMQAVLGDLPGGLEKTARQVEQAPFSPSIHGSLAMLYLLDRQPEAALSHATRARELSPPLAWAHLTEGQALVALGQFDAGIAAIETGLETVGVLSRPDFMGWLAAAHATAGNAAQAEQLLRLLGEAGDPFATGVALTGLGRFDDAFAAFSQVLWTDRETLHIRYNPQLDPLRADSRYDALIAALDRYWRIE